MDNINETAKQRQKAKPTSLAWNVQLVGLPTGTYVNARACDGRALRPYFRNYAENNLNAKTDDDEPENTFDNLECNLADDVENIISFLRLDIWLSVLCDINLVQLLQSLQILLMHCCINNRIIFQLR